jgi:hypothetical protein
MERDPRSLLDALLIAARRIHAPKLSVKAAALAVSQEHSGSNPKVIL